MPRQAPCAFLCFLGGHSSHLWTFVHPKVMPKMDTMHFAALAVSCIVLFAQLCAGQNVSVGLQDLVPNCRIFSQFSIGETSSHLIKGFQFTFPWLTALGEEEEFRLLS